jgi:hypothetical protein
VCVLSVTLNDTAVTALGILSGLGAAEPPGGLAPMLRERVNYGLAYRGDVVTWGDSDPQADMDTGFFVDLTAWECANTSFHLEDYVPVDVATIDDAPLIDEPGQRVLLAHGLAAALEFAERVHALKPPAPIRCIITAGESNGTFRFHRIRPGENWNRSNLDEYKLEKVIVVDIHPME